MKKIISLALAAAMALSLVACGGGDKPATPAGSTGTAAPAEKITMKIATTGNEVHQSTIAANAFAEKIAELSGGTMEATVYPNSQLGSEREATEGVKMGSLEMTVVTSDGAVPAFVPETQVLSIPYMFESKEEAYYVLDNFLQNELAPKFEAQGMKHLAFCELGFRHFTNNKANVQSAADMKGLSIRVQEAPIWFALADCLGFIATPIAFNELYTALQQGTVSAQDNPLHEIVSRKFYEVQPYITLTDAVYTPFYMAMSKITWDAMSESQQALIVEAAAVGRAAQHKLNEEATAAATQVLLDAGCTIEENPDKAAFQEVAMSVWPLFTDKYGTELLDMIQK